MRYILFALTLSTWTLPGCTQSDPTMNKTTIPLFCDPDKETAEYGILVRSDLQGRGIGWALLNHVIDYARTEGIKRIDGSIFAENTKMLTMAKDLGFSVRPSGTDRTVLQVSLTL